jgi:hypothetical protein
VINFEAFDWLFKSFIASLVIPILCIPIKAKWSNIFNKNDIHTIGKSAYKNFLITNSKPIGSVFYKIDDYKQNTILKYFFFFEGIPLGAFITTLLFISFFKVSEIKGFNKFSLLEPYYNYLNYGYNDKFLIVILLYFTIFSSFGIFIIQIIIKVFYSKGYSEPKLTEKLSLKKRSKYFYYLIWLSMGSVIGVNIIVFGITVEINDVIIKFIKSFLTEQTNYDGLFFITGIYLVCIGNNCQFIFTRYIETILFSNLFKQEIYDFYINEFPWVQIKTNAEDISGKIENIQNESLLILNDGCLVKAIRWDQITTMEIEKAVLKDKITMEPVPEVK